MDENDSIDELKAKWICYKCINDKYLSGKVRRNGQRKQCSYCESIAKSYTIKYMAELMEKAFKQHYRRTPEEPSPFGGWERDGEQVVYAIMNAADIPESAAQDIQAILEDEHFDYSARKDGYESEFNSESYYEEIRTDDYTWQEQWRSFERSLKTESRFFIRKECLLSIFSGIEKMSSTDGKPLVIDAGPETNITAIYRARIFQSEERLKEALCRPDLHIGPPPAPLASAGRMNAHGISVFYGANNPDVAIAEVRPPVGSHVAVARFDIIRPLRLLDLTALGKVVEGGSVFDPGLATRLEYATFLLSLYQRMIRPIMPDDQDFEYLPTQAIADFLATENEPVLDGILYPSVQIEGDVLNVVLFHKAARVKEMDIPKGTKIEASTGNMYEDGWEIDYDVFESVPYERSANEKDEVDQENFISSAIDFAHAMDDTHDNDFRHETLRIDLESVKVHIVKGVHYQYESHDVRRDRQYKGDPEYF